MEIKYEVIGDAVFFTLPNGRSFQVSLFTRHENEARISTTGDLLIVPQASNSVSVRLPFSV